MRKHQTINALRRGLAVLACAAAVAACSPMVDSRGNLPVAERLALVKPGAMTRTQVAELLGTPATLSAFGDATWFYVSYRTETIAFMAPKQVERTVIAVDFDERGFVKAVRQLGLEDGKAVAFSPRETPTVGKELNLLQQFLGNVGRFSPDDPGSAASGN